MTFVCKITKMQIINITIRFISGYNTAFWAIILFSATDFFRLILNMIFLTLSAVTIIVILLKTLNKSDSNISEYIFLAFWGIFSYFTNCTICLPTSEDVTYGSQIFSPEVGSLRYFAVTLIITSERDAGNFSLWLISVICASILLNYLSVQTHSTHFEGISNEYDAKLLSKLLSCTLLFLVLLTSYFYCSSLMSLVVILFMTLFRIQCVAISIERKIKYYDNYDILSRVEIYYLLLSLCYVGAYVFFVRSTHLLKTSVPMIYLSVETSNYIYLILKHVSVLRSHRQNFWRNTSIIPKSKKGEQCPVCLADIWIGRVTSCGHVFHSGCLARCLHQSSVCPMCRGNIGISQKRQ